MEKKRTAAVLIALVLLLTACTYPAQDHYQDILADTDALMRFTICFDDVRKGRATPYTRTELLTLSRDLEEGYGIDDPQAHEATRQFREAAALLAEYIAQDDPPPSLYRKAEACYAAGVAAVHRIQGT